MKPNTPETGITVKNNLTDGVNGLSVNSIDGRIQVIGKSVSSDSTIVFPNYDGTTAGIKLPSGYQGMFLLPFVKGQAGLSSSGMSDFYFIKDGVPQTTSSVYGITNTNQYNSGKLYYIDSNGKLAKLSSSSQLRTSYGYNTVTGSWEKKGVVLEPPTNNRFTSSSPNLGVTGATATVSVDYAAGYWDAGSIPGGMTVWKLTEITTGPNKENTVFFPSTSINLSGFTAIHSTTSGISYSTFMVSAFFTGPNKIGGITKDVIQIWLATNPAGTVKKSVFFNLSDCAPVAVSAGGTTLAYYNTEYYANGWCRCFAGIGYTGATFPASGGIPQFGFSTARPDGSGGYTYGNLSGASAGSLYFSGLKFDVFNVGYEYSSIGGGSSNPGLTTAAPANTLYALKLGPTSYTDPNINSTYPHYLSSDEFRWFTKFPSWFNSGMTNGTYSESLYYDFTVNGPGGVTLEVTPTDNLQGYGGIVFVNNRLTNQNGVDVGQNYTCSPLLTYGLASGGIPNWRIYCYFIAWANNGGVFNGYSNPNALTRFHDMKIQNKLRGLTLGERVKLVTTGVSGALKSFVNGTTGENSWWRDSTGTITGVSAPQWNFITTSNCAGTHFYMQAFRDKVIHIMNWAFMPRALTDTDAQSLTSFGAQGLPRYKFAGNDGGYNESSSGYSYIGPVDVVSINNTSKPLPSEKYIVEVIP